MALIQVQDLTVRYPQRTEPTLRNLSFELKEGECLLVIGPSGCGKTTLALALGGFFPQSIFARVDGNVSVGSVSPLEQEVSRVALTVGLVFQNPNNQIVRSSVYSDLAFGPENLGWDPVRIAQNTDRALGDFGLSSRARSFVQSLSSGLKQRLALAGHGVMNPELFVLDEPTSYLDPRSRKHLVKRLSDFKGDRTLILFEHDCSELMGVVDRLLVLNETGGRSYLGPPRQYFEELRAEERLFEAPALPASVRIQNSRRPTRPAAVSPARREGNPKVDSTRGDPEAASSAPELCLTLEELRQRSERFAHSCGVLPLSSGSAPGPRLCRLESLHLQYESGTRALNGVSATLHRGEIVGMAGVNGSGKTSLGRLLAGLREPSGGRLVWEEGPLPTNPGYGGRVGYVFENPEYQFISSSVREEIMRGAQEDPEPWLEQFDLTSVADHHPFQLSHGQQRRLSIATAAATQPDLLVLDEPLTGLDRAQILNVRTLLENMRKSGTSLVVISHNLEFLLRCANRIWMLHKGELRFSGTTREWCENPEAIVEVGLWPPPSLEMMLREDYHPPDGSAEPHPEHRLHEDGPRAPGDESLSFRENERDGGSNGSVSTEPAGDFAHTGDRGPKHESGLYPPQAGETGSKPPWLWRIHPVYKILGALVWMIPVLVTGEPKATATTVIALLGLAQIGRIPFTRLVRFLLPALGFALSLGLITFVFYAAPSGAEAWFRYGPIFLGPPGLTAALAAFLRVLALVLISGVVSLTTTSDTLALGLAQHGPVPEKLAFSLLVGSRFLPALRREYRSIRDARVLRQGHAGWNSLWTDVFLTVAAALRKSEQVARAMDSRCFGASHDRTYLRTIPIGWKDVLFVGGSLLLVLFQLAAFLWWGWLNSTSII